MGMGISERMGMGIDSMGMGGSGNVKKPFPVISTAKLRDSNSNLPFDSKVMGRFENFRIGHCSS